MPSRPSIYDLLSERYPAKPSPSREAPEVLRFHTGCLVVEEAWLRCGSGDIHAIMAADTPPFFCDFGHDRRIRDRQGNYLGISRMEGGGEAALDPRVRACQLLELTLKDLLASPQDPHWQASRVILQALPEVADEDWLDDVLRLWPVDRQPAHGMAVTSLPFDEWLAEELACETGRTEWLQFIAVAPLCVSPASLAMTPPGEAVACLWLRRARADAAPAETAKATLKLMPPVWTSHEPRHEVPRGSAHLIESSMDALGADTEEVQAVVWDGDRRGFRFDHLIRALQQRLPHLFLDTDLWSVQGAGGSVPHASAAFQVVLATHLARQRQGDILLLDSRDEGRTLAMWLHREDVSHPLTPG